MSARIKFAISFFHTLHTPITSATQVSAINNLGFLESFCFCLSAIYQLPFEKQAKNIQRFLFLLQNLPLGENVYLSDAWIPFKYQAREKVLHFPNTTTLLSLHRYKWRVLKGVWWKHKRGPSWWLLPGLKLCPKDQTVCLSITSLLAHKKFFYLCSALVCKWVLAAELSWWYSCLLFYS